MHFIKSCHKERAVGLAIFDSNQNCTLAHKSLTLVGAKPISFWHEFDGAFNSLFIDSRKNIPEIYDLVTQIYRGKQFINIVNRSDLSSHMITIKENKMPLILLVDQSDLSQLNQWYDLLNRVGPIYRENEIEYFRGGVL